MTEQTNYYLNFPGGTKQSIISLPAEVLNSPFVKFCVSNSKLCHYLAAEHQSFSKMSSITKDEVKELLKQYVKKTYSWKQGSELVDEVTIQKIVPLHVHVYKLEIFMQYRKGNWSDRPYGGYQENIEPEGMCSVNPWDPNLEIEKRNVPYEASAEQIYTVPNSTTISNCTECCLRHWGRTASIGKIPCPDCKNQQSCNSQQCHLCRNTGVICCRSCNGLKRMKKSFEVTVKFEKQLKFGTFFNGELEQMYKNYFLNVIGKTMFEQVTEGAFSVGLTEFLPNPNIAALSEQLMASTLWETEGTDFRPDGYRHSVVETIGHLVKFTKNRRHGMFLICGDAQKFEFPIGLHPY